MNYHILAKKIIKKYYNIEILCLLLIIALAIFFRFYNTPARYGFDPDPTRDILIIINAAKEFKFPLIGAMSGIAPFTFGPWYYYQLILFQIIFPFNYAPWIYIGVTSVIAVFITYKIGFELEGKKFGLLLAFLAALSPSETGQTQGLSNPNLIPLFASLSIWIFIKVFNKKVSNWWVFLWGVTLSIGINIHYEMVGLCILPLIYFIFKRERNIVRIGIFFLGFFIPWIPLLTFNILHHWHTVTGIVYFITIGRHTTYIPNSWRIYIINFWLPFWSYIFGVPTILGAASIVISFGTMIYLFIKKQLRHIYKLLLAIFIVNFLFLRYFLVERDYYYYLFLHEFIFIFFGLALWNIYKYKKGKYLFIFILLCLSFMMVQKDDLNLGARQDQQVMHMQAISLVNTYPNKNFSFYVCSKGSANIAEGIEFFLNSQNKLSDNNTVRVGVIDWACNKNLTSYDLVPNQKNLENLQTFSNRNLLREGWENVTPASIYKDTLAWW